MNLVLNELTIDDEVRWDAYAQKTNASIYHLTKWRHLIRNIFGHDNHYLFVTEENNIVGILPLIYLKSPIFGKYLVSMPYFNYGGIIADNNEVESFLLTEAEILREKIGAEHLELRETKEINDSIPVRTDKVTMLLDLPDDPEILWKSIGAKRRSQIKRPIREGVEYLYGGSELLDDFYYVFSRNMRDLGTPVYSKKLFSSILSDFPNDSFIAVVRLNGEAVGAGFLLGWNGKLEIPWASTLRKFNRIGVNMFLYWNILKTAIEKEYKIFDFGRSSKDAGTLKFKKQWGSQENQLYWHYLMDSEKPLPGLNPANPKYKMAISIWKRLPVSVTNVLGPAIVKGLP